MAEPQINTSETQNSTPSPGAVITPRSVTTETAAATPVINAQPLTATPPAPAPTVPETITPPSTPQVAETPKAPEPSKFAAETPTAANDGQSIAWTASEFHSHEKSAGWYLLLAVGTVIVAAILYFLTKGILTSVVVVACGIVLGLYARRAPKQLEYTLNRHGIQIGAKQYTFDEFQLFVVTPESPFPEITLMPVRRFMPPLSVRYEPADEKKILDMLAEYLPFEERRPQISLIASCIIYISKEHLS